MDGEIKFTDIYPKELKLKHLGEGEWVTEPDIAEFQHMGIECKIFRMLVKEYCSQEEHYSLGHLCGYVKIPIGHPFINGYENNENPVHSLDIHGGITFGEYWKDGSYWIGFDCGHSGDYQPALEHFNKTDPKMIEFRKNFPIDTELLEYSIFNPVYRNMDYVIQECKNLAAQVMGRISDEKENI